MPTIELPAVLAVLLFLVLYGWADRFSGGGFGWDRLSRDGGGPLRGHGVFYAGIVLLLSGYLLAGWWGLGFGLAWSIARSMPWRVAGRSAMTPNKKDIPYALFRHSYAVILLWGAGFAAWVNGEAGPPLMPVLVLYPILSTMLARYYAERVRWGEDIGARIEIFRGAIFGLLTGVILST